MKALCQAGCSARLISVSVTSPAAPPGNLACPHLPHMIPDAPIGHHFQGVQGHLLSPGAILGEPVTEPIGEQEVQDHCGAG